MRRTASSRNTKASAVQIVCVLLLLALLALILTNEILRAATTDTEKVERVRYAVIDHLEGYVFRDEVAVTNGGNNGVVCYRVSNGATVAAGDLLAEVYRDETGTDQRARAAVLLAEKARLQEAQASTTPWQPDYVASYAELMNGLSVGNLRGAAASAAALADALCHRAVENGASDAYTQRIQEIDAEIADMVKHVDALERRQDELSGAFYYDTDGYEMLFGKKEIDTLTPERLSQLLATPNPVKGHVGKVIDCQEWYLALPIAPELADAYRVGSLHTAWIDACNVQLTMELTAIRRSADGGEALLILRADRKPAGLDAARRHAVRLEREPIEGITVSASALREENGECGVYVAENGVARWRRVELLDLPAGVAICTVTDAQGALHEGEAVILTAHRLYDGKALR